MGNGTRIGYANGPGHRACFSAPIRIGNADYRLGGGTPRLVGTVPFGCFPRPLFEEIGLFDEELVRNQDDEFNGRIIRSGGKILLLPDLKIRYFARERLVQDPPDVLPVRFIQTACQPETRKTGHCPSALSSIAGGRNHVASRDRIIWISMIGLCWWRINGLLNDGRLFFPSALKLERLFAVGLFRAFRTIHLSYGIGYWIGIIRFLIFRKNQHGKVHDPGISR